MRPRMSIVLAAVGWIACGASPEPVVEAPPLPSSAPTVEVELHLDTGEGHAWLPLEPGSAALASWTEALEVRPIQPGQHRQDSRAGMEVRYAFHEDALQRTDDGTVYTAFHTPRWMPAELDPSEPYALSLTLVHPADWVVSGTGERETLGPGRTRFLLPPHPSYLFGFVAGPTMQRATHEANGRRFEMLHPGFAPEELEVLTNKAADAIALFETLAGRRLDTTRLTLNWVEANVAQELAHGATMSADEARTMLANPEEDWLLVHELAHQFWGNRVRAATWAEFWLNEGFATFMTAVFKERTHGRHAYDREVTLAEQRLERLREAGRDRPLVGPSSTTVDEAGGPLVYSKGLLLLHTLRNRMGDEAFFAGIARYTRQQWDRPTTTADLARALQAQTSLPLGPTFDQYGARASHL